MCRYHTRCVGDDPLLLAGSGGGFEADRDIISDPDRTHPGMVLRIPLGFLTGGAAGERCSTATSDHCPHQHRLGALSLMESELVTLGIGALIGFLAGRNWAEWHRARSDGRKAMKARKDHRR